MNRHPYRSLLLLVALAFTACGGSAGDAEDGESAVPQDTTVRQVERQPLTDADLMGIERASVAMELPWTSNRVARDPGAAPRGAITSITATGHETFDRVVVTFDEISRMTGYDVSFLDAGAEVPCGGGPEPVSLAGDRMLVVRTRPSRAVDEGGRRTVQVRTSTLGHTRLAEGGLVCDDADTTIWAAGVTEGTEVRVLELRGPTRLVVDIR